MERGSLAGVRFAAQGLTVTQCISNFGFWTVFVVVVVISVEAPRPRRTGSVAIAATAM